MNLKMCLSMNHMISVIPVDKRMQGHKRANAIERTTLENFNETHKLAEKEVGKRKEKALKKEQVKPSEEKEKMCC